LVNEMHKNVTFFIDQSTISTTWWYAIRHSCHNHYGTFKLIYVHPIVVSWMPTLNMITWWMEFIPMDLHLWFHSPFIIHL
jgi:hypothetical protein